MQISVMQPKLKNATVTGEIEVARWARLEAARRKIRVSRLLGQVLNRRMLEEDGYDRVIKRALARRCFPKT